MWPRNGQFRVAGSVRRRLQEPAQEHAGTGAIRQKNPNRERLGFRVLVADG